MKRLSTIFIIILITSCASTTIPKDNVHLVYSKYPQCSIIEDYNPLQVSQTNESHEKTIGSAFYIGVINGKHIFITNAHLVFERNPNKYFSYTNLIDKNRVSVRAHVVNVKEERLFWSSRKGDTYFSEKIADLAVLEVTDLPKGFATTKLNLSNSKENGVAFSTGINYSNQKWQGCFGLIHQRNHPYLYSENTTATESLSGSPVLDTQGQVIGIITSSGNLLNGYKNRKTQLYITIEEGKAVIISKKKRQNSKMLFAILTPTIEIRNILKETYGNVF